MLDQAQRVSLYVGKHTIEVPKLADYFRETVAVLDQTPYRECRRPVNAPWHLVGDVNSIIIAHAVPLLTLIMLAEASAPVVASAFMPLL
jgi:hypothetical protein